MQTANRSSRVSAPSSVPYNPYSGQLSVLNTTTDGVTQLEARMFAETKRDYYVQKWFQAESAEFKGFNWMAFLFPAAWMGYRRLYREAAVYALLCNAILIPLILSGVGLPVLLTLCLLSDVIIGAVGNNLYYNKAVRTKRKALALSPSVQQSAYYVRRGGVSVIGLHLCDVLTWTLPVLLFLVMRSLAWLLL